MFVPPAYCDDNEVGRQGSGRRSVGFLIALASAAVCLIWGSVILATTSGYHEEGGGSEVVALHGV